jgi:exopolysaccharide production protein ExoZ
MDRAVHARPGVSAEERSIVANGTAPVDVPGRLDGLQLGRAIAAATVIVGHSVDHRLGGATSEAWQLGARYGVTLFFIISGFIMVQTTGTGSFDPRRFLSRRVRRVAPIYWFVTLLVTALTLLVPQIFHRTLFDLKHLIHSLLFIPMYDPAGKAGIVPIFRLGWTLNFEMFFYLIFAFTFALGLMARAVTLTLFFVACILLGMAVSFEGAVPRFYTQIDTLGFVAGVWLGVLNLRGRLLLGNGAIAALLALSTAILLYIIGFYHLIRPLVSTQVLLVVACAAHVALLLAIVDQRHRRVSPAWLHIGDASYSIYLFHMFAIGAVTSIALRLPDALTIPMIGVAMVAGLVAGLLGYRLVERPLNQLMRRRRPLTADQLGDDASTAPPAGHGRAS